MLVKAGLPPPPACANMHAACRDLLVKNLKRARKAHERDGRAHEYDFFPQTFVLPSEYGLFAEEFRKLPGAHHAHTRALHNPWAAASFSCSSLRNSVQLRGCTTPASMHS